MVITVAVVSLWRFSKMGLPQSSPWQTGTPENGSGAIGFRMASTNHI